MEISIKMSCGCKCRWHDLDVPPALGSPAYCEAHKDVDIADVDVHGVADFYIRDTQGNWWHRGRVVSDDELASALVPLTQGEDYDTFPIFSKSVLPILVIIYR